MATERYDVSEELSREADARCCAEIIEIVEKYLPLMRAREARPYVSAMPHLRLRAGLDPPPPR